MIGNYLIGEGVIQKIEDFVSDWGNNFTIICDPNLKEIGEEIVDALSFDVQFIEHNSIERKDVEDLAKSIKYDFVIGVGGGRTLDCAKYASYLAKKKWISFPTTLSHDGIVSSRAILSENKKWVSLQAKSPYGVIADLEIIKKSPYRYIAAGVGDLISNLSAVNDWRIADKKGKEKYNPEIGNLSILSAYSVIRKVEEIKKLDSSGLEILLVSLINSGIAMNLYGSSRPCSGSEHNFCHALTQAGYNVLHGEAVGVGTMISFYLQGSDWNFIKQVLTKVGLPTTAEGIGVDEDGIIKALVKAKNIRERYTIYNEKELDEQTAKEVCRTLGIIK